MPWNTGPSILGTGNGKDDVDREADVIFTAAFIGMTLFQSEKRGGLVWRVDMEPNTDAGSTRDKRTEDDRKSMRILNDLSSKVNHVVRTYLNKDMGGVSWGLTPLFSRGKVISAGTDAGAESTKMDPRYAQIAYTYLPAPQKPATGGQRADEMYIGRGAYCGLVIDKDGNAVTAMSTIRTTLNERTPGVGTRWEPLQNSDVFTKANSKNEATFTWGMINNAALQNTLKEQGMRFYPANTTPDPTKDIIGYTHGMIRSIYETVRMGGGTAFEMSIGTDTYKLASCLPCSSFMMANDVDASSSHVGKGESWVPYYSAESHNPSYYPDKTPIGDAITQCNRKHAARMHEWMTNGVAAMTKVRADGWIGKDHTDALDKLIEKLKPSMADNTVARDLFLDALTFHKSDAQRVDAALVYGTGPRRFCDGKYDWIENRQTDQSTKGTWETYQNPFTDSDITALHTAPDPLNTKYRIKASSNNKDDSLALDYVVLDAAGKVFQQGKLDGNGVAEFVPRVDVTGWKIKVGSERDATTFNTDTNYMISGGRYTWEITKS